MGKNIWQNYDITSQNCNIEPFGNVKHFYCYIRKLVVCATSCTIQIFSALHYKVWVKISNCAMSSAERFFCNGESQSEN